MKKNKRRYRLVLFLFIYSKIILSQIETNEIKNIVEKFLINNTYRSSDTELVNNKIYFLHYIKRIKCKKIMYDIYAFGNPNPHFEWSYLLIINIANKKYYIIGNENEPIQNLIKLNNLLNECKISSAIKLYLYELLIENYQHNSLNMGKIIQRDTLQNK